MNSLNNKPIVNLTAPHKFLSLFQAISILALGNACNIAYRHTTPYFDGNAVALFLVEIDFWKMLQARATACSTKSSMHANTFPYCTVQWGNVHVFKYYAFLKLMHNACFSLFLKAVFKIFFCRNPAVTENNPFGFCRRHKVKRIDTI